MQVLDNVQAGFLINDADVEVLNSLFARNGQLNYAPVLEVRGDGNDVVVRFNTFVQNQPGYMHAVMVPSSRDTIFNSNIVWDNLTFDDGSSAMAVGPDTVLSQNIIQLEEFPGNSTEDPLFTNAPEGDYSLLPNSPAVDAAGLAGAPPVDVEGNPRPLGAGPDMGAFESH
jgi:hypothetical protein